jgi:putative sigma-54 modulation protein
LVGYVQERMDKLEKYYWQGWFLQMSIWKLKDKDKENKVVEIKMNVPGMISW